MVNQYSSTEPVGHDPLRSHASDIYIMIHNSNKMTVMEQEQNKVMVEGHHNMRNCYKDAALRWQRATAVYTAVNPIVLSTWILSMLYFAK